MLKIGEFYTSYSAGYWQLVDLKPKIVYRSEIAYEDGTSISQKAGEVYGQWAILKKAFTPKMKPRIDFVFEDSSWLRPVSDEVQAEIDQYFAENPAYQKKFDTAPIKLRPMITNCWISVPSEKENEFIEFLKSLPAEFTEKEFGKLAASYAPYIDLPPSTHLLNLLSYPWNTNKEAELMYHGFWFIRHDERQPLISRE